MSAQKFIMFCFLSIGVGASIGLLDVKFSKETDPMASTSMDRSAKVSEVASASSMNVPTNLSAEDEEQMREKVKSLKSILKSTESAGN